MLIKKDTKFNIILPKEPTPVESFAGQELEKYLKLIFGGGSGKNINFVIGSAVLMFLSESEFTQAVPGPEGMMIQVKGDSVLLAGSNDSDDRGTLYAVYTFLEKYIGCCFGAYTETVPSLESLEITESVYTKPYADLCYRTAISQFSVWAGNADRGLTLPFIDWLAKNRYNRILTWVSVYEQLCRLGMIPELTKRGIRLTVGHHQACSTWLKNGKPSFYRLEEDGSRYSPRFEGDYSGQWVLCSRNEECVDAVSRNIIEWLEQNPIVDTVAFWPNDHGGPQCCCEKCKGYSKTENYLYFENEITKRITAKLPHVKTDVLIYQYLWECPDIEALDDGIVIDHTTWPAGNLRTCGKPDGSCITQAGIYKNLLKYRKICKNAVLYDYYMGNYNARQKYMPAADEMQSVYKQFLNDGISGSGTQIECFNLWNNLFNFYCFARTAYDTSLTMSDNLNEFKKLFGNGFEEIMNIITLCEDVQNGQETIRTAGKYMIENIDRKLVHELFEKALSKTTGAVFRNNIRMMRMVFRYSELAVYDKTEDTAREPEPLTYCDPTGEIAYMATHFDSYHANYKGHGIAIPVKNRTDKSTDDIWYLFD